MNTSITPPRNHISAFEYQSQGKSPRIVFGEFSGGTLFLRADADFEQGRMPTIFPMTVPTSQDEPFYYSLTEPGDSEYSLAALWQGKKYPVILGRSPKGEFTLSGLGEELRPIQANVFRLGAHSYRMYFWAHFHGTPRKVRMLMAESSDNHHWQVANDGRPVFCHYSDTLSRQEGFPAWRQCNDATALYLRDDGSFEVYSAALVTLDASSGTRYFQKDIWRGYVRVIQRWTGDGVENWSRPEIIATPDADDPVDLQMYYLCKTQLPHGAFGLLGRYSVDSQRMGMEPVWSTDGRHWLRPCRCLLGPDRESPITCPAQRMVEEGGLFRLYYSCSNYDHSFKTAENRRPETEIRTATIEKHRLFGAEIHEGTLISPPLRLATPEMTLYASTDSCLDFHWRNAFGEIDAQSVSASRMERGEWHLSLPGAKNGCTGRLEIRGSGTIFDLAY